VRLPIFGGSPCRHTGLFNFVKWREFQQKIRSCAWLSRYSDSLRAGRSLCRISVGARFSSSVQTDPGAHPVFYIMGAGSFPGVKRQWRGVNHLPPSSAEVKERVRLYLYSPCEPSGPVLGWPLYLPYSIEAPVATDIRAS
jgi:hypothetical protein